MEFRLNANWDLSDLYLGFDDPSLEIDIEKVKKLNLDLESTYKGRVAQLTPSEFLKAIRILEEDALISSRLYTYANLSARTNMQNQEVTSFRQMIEEKVSEYSKPAIFFNMEVNALSDEKIDELMNDAEVIKYKSFIEKIRKFKKYELSSEAERILVDKSITSGDAWVRLYEEFSASLVYRPNFGSKEYSEGEIMAKTRSGDADIRYQAGKEIERINTENIFLYTYFYNMIMKDMDIETVNRGYEKPISYRNISNNVEDKTVEALTSAVRNRYADITHRFYKLKSRWFNKSEISYWDRDAPLPFENNIHITLQRAAELILEAYKDFSPELYNLAKNFFEKDWIDYFPKKGKHSGAFCSGGPSDAHPYLLVNYSGTIRDVLVLAHELGHGCHRLLSRQVGNLLDDTPITLTEVASIFGEFLVFDKLLKEVEDDREKLCLLASKIRDRITTVSRQIAFHQFEQKTHEARKHKELSSQEIGQIWREVMSECYGENIKMSENFNNNWVNISHFFETPFYVYGYAFADCSVNSLYGVYKKGSVENFEEKYLELLKNTGIKKYEELFDIFGLDPKNPEFWDMGLSFISKDIDELETLTEKLGL